MKHYYPPVVEMFDETFPHEICAGSAGNEDFNELVPGTELWENE